MVERCEWLTIELERQRRQNSTAAVVGDASCTFNHVHHEYVHHEYCQRSAEQARREVEALRDENSRLAMILEMERLKNFNDDEERRTKRVDNDSQTDSPPEFERPGRIRLHSAETETNAGRDGLLGHAEAARAVTSRLRHLLKSGGLDFILMCFVCRTYVGLRNLH